MSETANETSPQPDPPYRPPPGPVQIMVNVESHLDGMLCPIVHHLTPPALEYMRQKAGEEVTALRRDLLAEQQKNDQLQAALERQKETAVVPVELKPLLDAKEVTKFKVQMAMVEAGLVTALLDFKADELALFRQAMVEIRAVVLKQLEDACERVIASIDSRLAVPPPLVSPAAEGGATP